MGILTPLFTVLSWAVALTSLSFSFITCQMGITLLLLLSPPPPSLPFLSSPSPSLFSSSSSSIFSRKGKLVLSSQSHGVQLETTLQGKEEEVVGQPDP